MPTLARDIVGAFAPRIKHGAAGDKITIIALHGHVFIVEGPDGRKFHALADDILGVPAAMLTSAREAEAQMKRSPVPMKTAEPAPAPEPLPSAPLRRAASPPKAARTVIKPSENQGSLF